MEKTVSITIDIPLSKVSQLSDFVENLLSDKQTEHAAIIPKQTSIVDIRQANDDKDKDNPPTEKKVFKDLGKSTKDIFIPWDERIHRKSKKKSVNGRWLLKPNLDKLTLLPQVEAELAELVGENHDIQSTMTYNDLINMVLRAKRESRISDKEINQACDIVGIERFGVLAVKTQLIPKMAKVLNLD